MKARMWSTVALVTVVVALAAGCDFREDVESIHYAGWADETSIAYLQITSDNVTIPGFLAPDTTSKRNKSWDLLVHDTRTGADTVLQSIELPDSYDLSVVRAPRNLMLRRDAGYFLISSAGSTTLYDLERDEMIIGIGEAVASPSGAYLLVHAKRTQVGNDSVDLRIIRAATALGHRSEVDLTRADPDAPARFSLDKVVGYVGCTWTDDVTVACGRFVRQSDTEKFTGVEAWEIEATTGRVLDMPPFSLECAQREIEGRNLAGETFEWTAAGIEVVSGDPCRF